MKLTHTIFTLGYLLVVSGETAAADWWFVPADPHQDRSAVVYVEKSSMHRARGTGKVTTQVWKIYRSDQVADFGTYRSGKIRMIMDCEKKEFGSAEGTFYSSFGGVVHQYRNPVAEMTPVQPESVQEIMAAFMCSDGKMPPRSLPVYDPVRDAEQRLLQYDRDKRSKPGAEPNESARTPSR